MFQAEDSKRIKGNIYLVSPLRFKHFVRNKELEQEEYVKRMLEALFQEIYKGIMSIKTVLMILAS